MSDHNTPILLSTDSLPGFGLDLIFSLAQEAGYDGIDLALWKNFDAWHEGYVNKLSENYKLPVYSVQTSNKVNAKELNQAIRICEATGAGIILINPPHYFDVKTYSFITSNLKTYQDQYPDISFGIISPESDAMAYLPFPKYRFRHPGEIVKKLKCKLGWDIATMDEDMSATLVLGAGKELIKHISVCYVSDRKKDNYHLLPGEGDINLSKILKTLENNQYSGLMSIKLNLERPVLVDNEKVLFHLQKSIQYLKSHYTTKS